MNERVRNLRNNKHARLFKYTSAGVKKKRKLSFTKSYHYFLYKNKTKQQTSERKELTNKNNFTNNKQLFPNFIHCKKNPLII